MSALRLLLVFVFSLGLLSCGLISKDFDGTVRVLANVDDPGDECENQPPDSILRCFTSTFDVNPNENEDVKNNRDKIETGEVTSIVMEIVKEYDHNGANWLVGQVDVRAKKEGQGEKDGWIPAVGKWDGIPVEVGNHIPLKLPVETQKRLNDLIFADETNEIDIQLQGYGDQGPIAFDFEVVINLRFTATL